MQKLVLDKCNCSAEGRSPDRSVGASPASTHQYELSDWLGNVRVVINDRKNPVNTGNVTVSYKPQVLSITDYYAYGSQIAERTHQYTYRYSFNGFEKDEEIKGVGNHLSFGDYGYDTRLGVRWNVEPKFRKYPQLSTYAVLGRNPIRFMDKDGNEIVDPQGRRAVEIVEGKVVITQYATEDIKTVVNAMNKTNIGKEIIVLMVASDNQIKIKIDKENRKYFNPQTSTSSYEKTENSVELFGETMIDKLNTNNLPDVTITIFEKSIDDLKKLPSDKVHVEERANYFIYVSDYSKEDIIGAIGVHEGTHATDKKSNIITNPNSSKKEREEKPQKNELEHYIQIDKSKVREKK